MKICTKCKIEKQLSEFNKQKDCAGGLTASCRACLSKYKSEWRLANIDRQKKKSAEWRSKNPEKSKYLTAKWVSENPERVKSTRAAYYLANSTRICAETARWSLENKEKVSAYKAAYKERNPEKTSAGRQNRRSLLKGCKGAHTGEDIKLILERQRFLCAGCGKKLFESGKKKYHIDHIVPLARCGTNDKYNLQCLCPSCNCRKSDADPILWANKNGRLL